MVLTTSTGDMCVMSACEVLVCWTGSAVCGDGGMVLLLLLCWQSRVLGKGNTCMLIGGLGQL